LTSGGQAENADHAGFDPQLRIDWLTPGQLGDALPGRLGLTILPGKHGASFRYPGRVYRRELDADLRALSAAGVRRLVLLVDDRELHQWSDPRIVERGREEGVEVLRFPIPDGHAPASIAEAEAILAAIRESRRTGDVAVACMGGVGRTGTVAACCLVAGGMAAARAISTVRAVRHPTAVETEAQERFVEAFASARQAAERA
jgi:protein-tyrosine phosphatase